MPDFQTLGLSPAVLKSLTLGGLTDPTPIQQQAIPLALAGHDIMGLAQTGTGKTLAFGLPLIERLSAATGKPAPKAAKSLILAPTRELVNQIAASLQTFTTGTRLRVTTVVGGQSIGRQINALARGTDILVATPGRLIDLMERRAVDLGAVKYLVLDEADQMLDMGFIHALRKIAPALGTPRQTMLFSATMPKLIDGLARTYLVDPKRVEVSAPGKAADKITQSVHFVAKGDKPAKLREILNDHPDATTLVFSRTKHGAEKLMKGLVANGFNAASIHGNKSQGQRDRTIKGFREGQIRVLVATDVAARGIDIPDVALVVNYELPDKPDTYVHRIGRTARAGRDGGAMALCCGEEVGSLKDIERLMGMDLPVASGTRPQAEKKPAPGGRRGGGRPAASKPGGGKRTDAKRAGGKRGDGDIGAVAKPKSGGPRRPRRRRAA